jgi:hypothetical protein
MDCPKTKIIVVDKERNGTMPLLMFSALGKDSTVPTRHNASPQPRAKPSGMKRIFWKTRQ